MDAARRPGVLHLLARAKDDPDVLAVLVFGSEARGEAGPESDIDLCLVLGAGIATDRAKTEKQLDYLSEDRVDVAVFQLLPLHIRSRVLKEGRVLFVRDEDALYEVAFRTLRAWEAFRHIYRDYLDEIARG